MAEVRIEDDVAAGVDAVWAKIADFGGIADWAPGLEKCELEGEGIGCVRRIAMGGMQVAERLEKLDAVERSLTYSIVEGPMPIENYLATITVSDAGNGRSHIVWTCSFDAPGMSNEQAQGLASGMEGAYRGMIGGLQQQFA